ncbi:KCNC1 [Mytilus edulis]|uniref:KCNC1 n=1 Tax=Mytilus edulis TaxID=6550 RepID=A0A8S3PV98_MYTED|nr:KCNC1 [Mytilus edulis]
MEDELITLNIGGTIFKTYRSKLIKYPNSKLGSLTTASKHYLPSSKEYFFDRNPELFNVVLDYYRYDRQQLHIPNYTCGSVLLQEFDFWGLPLVNIADCCFHIYIKHEDELEIQQTLVTCNSNTQIGSSLTKSRSFRKQLWLVLDQPNSSRIAQIFFAIFMIMVVLSVLMSCMVTDIQFRVERPPPPDRSTNNRNQLIRTNSTTGNNTSNASVVRHVKDDGLTWKMKLFIETKPLDYIDYIDYVTTGFFILELLLHFLVCLQKKRFLKDNNNKIDVLLFLVTLLFWCVTPLAVDYMKYTHYRSLYIFANVTMMLKILRMFRLTKLYTELRILLITLQKSIKELMLLSVTFGIFAVLFGNLIYYCEMSESETFPDSFIGIWWSIITMTTVGYGDYVPKSSIGYFAGVITATTGVLIITMPIAIIAGKFDGYYTAYNTNKTKTKMRKLQKQEQKNSVAPLFNNTIINKH